MTSHCPTSHRQTSSTVTLRADEIGPEAHANGGFACGMFAELVGGTATVRLLAGVPVAVPLDVHHEADSATITVAGQPVAVARTAEPFALEPPYRPTMAEAIAAREAHPFRGVRHPLSDCIVCGPERADGLQVTPGPLAAAEDLLAAPFVPRAEHEVDGAVRREVVWGALDCPSYPAEAMRTGEFSLLGTLSAHQTRPVRAGEELVVVGWTESRGTRSHRTASAILAPDGVVVASARAVWVTLA